MDAATLAAKRGEYRELRQKALAVTDKAMAEDGPHRAEAKQLAEHVEQAKALHTSWRVPRSEPALS